MSASSVPSPSDSPQLVLDTWPVMEWLKDRKRAAEYIDLLLAKARRSEVRLFMSRMNLGEIYYTPASEWGVPKAKLVLPELRELPIELVSVSDEAVLQAAHLKIAHKISYADAFAASLAMELKCPLVTGDGEFLPLAQSGILELDWIGA
jgi:predicted nucleic acid-binding protein